MLEVRFFATLRKERGKSVQADFVHGITGLELIKHFEIPQCEVAIFLVNGFHTPLDKELVDNSVISIFPPVGGG